MSMQHTRQHMSLEQYLLLINHSDQHYEYYDGEVSLLAGGHGIMPQSRSTSVSHLIRLLVMMRFADLMLLTNWSA